MILAPLFALCISSPFTARAENRPNDGLSVTAYEINDGDYRMQVTERPVCGGAWTWAPNIEANFDYQYGGIVAGCRYDNVMIRYQGFITVPGEYGTSVDVTFSNVSDDGHLLIVNGETVINDPNFKPCSGQSGTITLIAGEVYPIESWFFEAGGGACNTLYWSLDDGPTDVVPASAFTLTPPPPPTTTTVPIIVPVVPEVTTTTEAPVATTPETVPTQATTTIAPSTTAPPGTTTVPTATTTTTTVVATTTTTTTTTTTVPATVVVDVSKITDPSKLTSVIDSLDLKKIKPEQAIALVTSAAFIELPKEKLAEVFDSIPVSELSPEQEAVLVETLTNAPDDVKQTFETAVDVYGSGLDEYVPTGSNVTVGARRSLIAVTTVMSTVAVGGAAPGTPGGQPNGNGGGTPGDANKAAKKDDEPEDEEAGGLEGPEERQRNTHTRNSIFTYGENNMKKFNPLGFVKKFMKETAALAFTFAGSAIMFVTLSGDTRRIAIIATVAAVLVHYVHVMLENDED